MGRPYQNERTGPRDENAARLNSVPKLLTVAEVAEITGLSIETLAQWRSQKRGIPYVKVSRNCVRYRIADLDNWLVEHIVRVDVDPIAARRS
jgi:excisionase family DNA binding protein